MNRLKKLLGPDEVADLLGVPKSWVYGRRHAGTLPFPCLKIGNYIRFDPADIHKYIQDLKMNDPTDANGSALPNSGKDGDARERATKEHGTRATLRKRNARNSSEKATQAGSASSGSVLRKRRKSGKTGSRPVG